MAPLSVQQETSGQPQQVGNFSKLYYTPAPGPADGMQEQQILAVIYLRLGRKRRTR